MREERYADAASKRPNNGEREKCKRAARKKRRKRGTCENKEAGQSNHDEGETERRGYRGGSRHAEQKERRYTTVDRDEADCEERGSSGYEEDCSAARKHKGV